MPYATFTNPQSLNLYSYMHDNPLNGTDPDGHFDCTGDSAKGIGCQSILTWNGSHGISPAELQKKNGEQQQYGDPTLPTAVAPPLSSSGDRIEDALFPKTWGDVASLALMAPTDGLAEGGAALTKTIEIISSIGEDSKLVKYAEDAGQSVQKGLDSLTKELSKGNTNPGLGTKSLGRGISYARARDGARVFFRQEGSQIENSG